MDLTARAGDGRLVCTVTDGREVAGYVVIDSVVGGRSCGGLRIAPAVDEAEVRALARGMTLKFGFLGLPQGGGKAGIRGDPDAPLPERRERIAAFGRAVAPLLQSGLYVPATDMGTDIEDIRHLLTAAGVRPLRRELRSPRTGYYTAVTAFAGVRQAARRLGLRLEGATAAIEGFGKVGAALAGLLDGAGVRVVAVSTSHGAIHDQAGLDVPRLIRLASDIGSRVVERYPDAARIERAALLELPVDLLCPCARHGSVHAGNAGRVAARAIVPGANDPVTLEAEEALFARGILCVPCFVANCGGVLGGTMEFAGVDRATIAGFMDRRVGARIGEMLEEAARQGVPPRAVAEPSALRRFAAVQHGDARSTLHGRVLAAGLETYRRGWLPRRLVGPLSLPYFDRILR